MNVEKLSQLQFMERNGRVCRVCGSDLMSCDCGTISAVDKRVGIKRPTLSPQAGGQHSKRTCFGEVGSKKTESESGNIDKMKTMGQASDFELQERDSGKSIVGRRFNDAPAVVPIKKRRIQISEVMRSPSPPPRSPSPQTPPSRATSLQTVSPRTSPAVYCISSPAVSSSSFLRSSSPSAGLSTPRSPALLLRSSTKAQTLPQSPLPFQGCDGEVNMADGVKSSHGKLPEIKEQNVSLVASSLTTMVSSCPVNQRFEKGDEQNRNEHDNTSQSFSEGCLQEATGHHFSNKVNNLNPSPEKSEGELVRSDSGSFSRDGRLHWDLNRDIAAWDAAAEDGTFKVSDYAAEIICRSTSRNSDGSSHDRGKLGHVDGNDDDKEQEPESKMFDVDDNNDEKNNADELEIGEVVREEKQESGEDVLEEVNMGEEESEIGKQTVVEEPGIGEQAIQEPEEIGEQAIVDQEIEEELLAEELEMGEQVIEEPGVTPRNSQCVEPDTHSSEKREEIASPTVHVAEFDRPVPWDGDLPSDGRDGHEQHSVTHSCHDEIPERHLSRFDKQPKSFSDDGEGWNRVSEEPELEEHVDYGDSDCREADDTGVDVDDRTSLMQDESKWKGEDGSYHRGARKSIVQGGEASDGETVVAASTRDIEAPQPSLEKRTRSRTTGWDQLPEGFDSAEEALRAAKEISSRRGGRGGSWSSPGGRGPLLSSHSSSRFGPVPARGSARDGFSSARSDSYFGDRHPDEIMHDRDSFRHGRRPDDSFGAARGRDLGRRPGLFGRGRVGGWIDSQPGHMNQWGPGRNRPTSGFGGPGNAASVSAARVENSGFLVAPDGTLTKPGGGIGLSRGMRSTGSGSRGGRGGHVQVGRGPPADMDSAVHYPLRGGVGAERVAGTNGGRGLGMGTGPGPHDRAGRGLLERYRGGVIDSRRSESPHRPHHLDHPNMMGRVTSMRPESRVVRSRTPPPSHHSLSHSEYTSTRSQRSPPPSRWSIEKREADGYHDRDFKRPLSRSRMSSQRTSPHVVHGSSLTDERDRQVLAGSRHSPSLKGPVNPAHVRKMRDSSLESRLSKRSEEDDVRMTGSFLKDGDYRRTSPPRDGDKERDRGSMYRRDTDRDDDRRRDSHRSSSRDGRFSSGHKHTSTREVDDDVAPRRRRPS